MLVPRHVAEDILDKFQVQFMRPFDTGGQQDKVTKHVDQTGNPLAVLEQHIKGALAP